jgi:hypothetical protein
LRKLASRNRALDANDQIEVVNRWRTLANDDAKHPPDSIAVDRSWKHLAADDETHSPGGARRRHRHELYEIAVAPLPSAENGFERACAREPRAATCRGHRRKQPSNQGVSRLRPLARRAERTLRPPTVFIRARKPCVRLRRTTDGWNVRFMVTEPRREKALH